MRSHVRRRRKTRLPAVVFRQHYPPQAHGVLGSEEAKSDAPNMNRADGKEALKSRVWFQLWCPDEAAVTG